MHIPMKQSWKTFRAGLNSLKGDAGWYLRPSVHPKDLLSSHKSIIVLAEDVALQSSWKPGDTPFNTSKLL